MMKSFILVISFLPLTTYAKEKHEHHEHKAHVHGAASLAIAFDDVKGRIEFKGAAEGILGFEYKPKNSKDQKKVDDAVVIFEKEIGTMIQFDAALKCNFTKDMIGQVPEKGEVSVAEHSDWAANFNVLCEKSPVGTKVIVNFEKFKLLKDLDVTVLAGSIQKSGEFKKKPLVIELN